MLTGAAIEALRQQGALRWQGPLRGDALLLRLGAPLQPLAAPPGAVDLLDQASIDRLYQPPLPDWTSFLLHPGQLVLCQVADPLRLGPQLGGWVGHLTLEVHNAGPASLLLRRGMPVAKALLYRLEGPPSPAEPSPYYCGASAHLGSRYAEEFAAYDTITTNAEGG